MGVPMNADRQIPRPSPRMERVLRAILPIGIGLLVVWLAWVGTALVVGVEEFGLGFASAALGLVTSLLLIVTGYLNRRELDRRAQGRR
jgi:apolipoprotein N-acyltransferase